MVTHYKTEGFVFKKEDRSEADRVFSMFTKDFGRIEIFGKAIRKIASKLKSGMEIFSLSEIEFIQGKNQKTLTDATSINKFNNLTKNPEKFLLAVKISQIIDSFIKGEEKDDNILDLLDNTFNKLNNYQSANNDCQLIYYYFLWNFIAILGYGPGLSNCAACGQKLNPYNLYFSNKEGGVICKGCATLKRDALKIKSDIVKILRLILKRDWNILSKLKIEINSQKLLKDVSNNYYDYLLHSYFSKDNLSNN